MNEIGAVLSKDTIQDLRRKKVTAKQLEEEKLWARDLKPGQVVELKTRGHTIKVQIIKLFESKGEMTVRVVEGGKKHKPLKKPIPPGTVARARPSQVGAVVGSASSRNYRKH